MCGIAGIVYKDKKLHDIGNDMTNMLHQLQHRGPDSAGYSIYGGTGLEENEYILKIQVKENEKLLKKVKDTINFLTPIKNDAILPSVGDSFIYKCKISLNDFSELKPLITKVDLIDDVIVINGSHDFEMIKDVGSVLEIADRYDVRNVKGTHAIGHTRFSTESGVDRYHAHPFQTYIVRDISVVHNGQITNYWKIRDPLERKGHVFETFNDTECLVHYIAAGILDLHSDRIGRNRLRGDVDASGGFQRAREFGSVGQRSDGGAEFVGKLRHHVGIKKAVALFDIFEIHFFEKV